MAATDTTPTASAEVVLPHPPAPGRVGQGTVIEQSRAVAEVYAAVMIAREAPRNVQAAIRAMTEACQQPELAARAFYKMPRGDKTVTDASIHLARELARCWGNIQSAIFELRRDDEHGQSEMQAVAWDLETNNRTAMGFIQPHFRDKKDGGLQKLTAMSAIYENNANAGARRLRQCIFSVLPDWYVERAKALCGKTLNGGGGKPLAERVADALRLFEHEHNTTEADIARVLGKPSDQWTGFDLGQLRITYESLQQGTLTVAEAFPPEKLDPADLAPTRPAEPAATPAAEPAAPSSGPATSQPPRDGSHAAAVRDPEPDPAPPTPTPPAPAKPEPETDPQTVPATGSESPPDMSPEASPDNAAPESTSEPASESAPDRAPDALLTKIRGQLDKVGVSAADRAGVLGDILRRRVRSTRDLTTADGQAVAEFLNRATVADDPVRAFDSLLDHHKETAP